MPKGAPGQPRTKGAGRKHSRDYDRTTIIVSQQVMDWLKRNGNVSAEVERLAQEAMNKEKAPA